MKNYSLSADIIRILAVFFVIFSHTTDVFVLWTPFKGSISWDIVYYMNTLSRVAVPVFVLLSGYLILDKTKTENIKQFYKRRFSKIAIPFVLWLGIYYWWAFYWGKMAITPQYILQTLWQANIWHLYFLIIILELYLITPFLTRFIQNKTRKQQTILFWTGIALSIFCAVLANLPQGKIDLAKNFFTIWIPYLGYFYAGAYLKQVSLSRIQTLFLVIGYFLLAGVTNVLARGNMSTFIVFNYSPTLLPMSICFFIALKNCQQLMPKFRMNSSIQSCIQFVSSTTFGIYLFHFLVLDIVRSDLHLFPWQIHAPLVFYACLPAFITGIIAFIGIAIMRKLPYSQYVIG